MRESLYNQIWRVGVQIRNRAKQEGLLGPLESILALVGPRLMPPPTSDATVSLPLGMVMLVPSNFPSYRNFAMGLYEVDVTKLFLEILKEDMTIADIGANIGYYSLIASRRVGSKGKVYAFEPEERNYSYLLGNISHNHANNIVAIRKAASNRNGTSALIPDGGGERNWLPRDPTAPSPIRVDTVTLDYFFQGKGWPSVDIVKMDIEGSEVFALEGMRELSSRNPQMRLIMEFNLEAMQKTGSSPQTLADSLRKLGFATAYIVERSFRSVPIERGLPRTRAVYNLLLTKQ